MSAKQMYSKLTRNERAAVLRWLEAGCTIYFWAPPDKLTSDGRLRSGATPWVTSSPSNVIIDGRGRDTVCVLLGTLTLDQLGRMR